MTKFCKECKVEKPLLEFYFSKKGSKDKLYPDSLCKSCKTIRCKKWFKENKKKAQAFGLKSKLKKRYNMTVEEYQTLLINQDGRCKICSKRQARRSLSVDHCHTTNVVRGLLCDKCNMALGLIHDNLDILDGMKQYLINSRGKS
jgi:hypothetical protein